MVTMGKPSAETLKPGLKVHAPFFQHLEKLDMTPMQYESGFSTGADGAISADQQTIGCEFSFIWKYSEDGVYEILTSYANREVLKQSVSDLLKEAIKTELGQYEVQNISKSQEQIKAAVLGRLESNPQFQKIPLDVKSLAISNYNWSAEYEAKVQETMNKKQEVERMKQDVALTEQEAQKKVKLMEAEKQKSALEAEARLIEKQKAAEAQIVNAEAEAKSKKLKAEADAEAKKKLADAELYEAQKLAQASEMKRAQWKHEETMKAMEVEEVKWKNWDGDLNPKYVPITAAGSIVNLPAGANK